MSDGPEESQRGADGPDGPARGAEPLGAESAWTGASRALLERAIERHGGWAAWERVAGVALTLSSLSGLVPRWKGLGQTFPAPTRAEVWLRHGVVVFPDYPAPGLRGIFSDGQVQIIDGATILQARAQPRASFSGWRKHRRWAPLDAIYFFGYALGHYHSLPFSLTAGRPLRLVRGRSAGRWLSGVEVELPAWLHTHCRRQTFYFDGEGLLRRHDYVADVVGWWARGAHHWEDFIDVAGLPVARRRHVVARFGRLELPIVALHAQMVNVGVLTAPGGLHLKLV